MSSFIDMYQKNVMVHDSWSPLDLQCNNLLNVLQILLETLWLFQAFEGKGKGLKFSKIFLITNKIIVNFKTTLSQACAVLSAMCFYYYYVTTGKNSVKVLQIF